MPVSRCWPGARKPAWMISGHSGCAGSTPPTTSCARMSLLTNVTRCPTAIVISSGDMPVAVMVMVGGPDDTGGTGGVGDVGTAAAPLEHAATAINDRTMKVDR